MHFLIFDTISNPIELANMKSRSILLFVILVLCNSPLSLSFAQDKISLRKNGGRPVRQVVQISSQDLEDVLSDELIPQQETELWLDLRRTAIHPKAAIEQLETQLGLTSFVDRILLSEREFQNLKDFKSNKS